MAVQKQVSKVILCYDDGSREEVEHCLVGRMTEAQTVSIDVCDLKGPEMMSILGAFQFVLDGIRERS